MKKYIQSMMAFAAIVSFASCSSEDNNSTIENESAVKVMTFTAMQEGNEASTRAILSGTNIHWESEDEISIFDGKTNNQFTLKDGKGTPNATFTGEALESGPYTAVYPYQSTASLSGNDVTNVTLPAIQYARDNSFDKNAALMMAKGTNTTLEFKNAVGYVKVTPKFACSKIVLQAAVASEYLAGMCTLSYGDGMPSIAFTSEQSTSITLSGNITANTVYYIAVPAVTLSAGWSISFTDTTGDVYTRIGSNSITFKRNTIIKLGEFSRTDNNLKLTLSQNGNVSADKQVDMGVFNIGGTKYRLIFAKSNLTTKGLAANESDYGDYFAWGAKEPWYLSISGNTFTWKPDHSSGYVSGTAPAFSPEYTSEKDFEMSDDPARKILGGDWQIPTKAIWYAFVNNSSSKSWDSGYKFTNNSQTLFLPAAGYVPGKNFSERGSGARYWSGTAYSSSNAYRLSFSERKLNVGNIARQNGCSVRPVRLVAVD